MNIKRFSLSAAFLSVLFFISTTPASADEFTMMAVGDILPHPSWQSIELPISKLLDGAMTTLFGADLVVGNLETPLTDKAEPTANKNKDSIRVGREFVFKAESPGVAQGLKDAGFAVLTLANNHMLDYREAGLRDTLARLKAAGIATAGAGLDFEGAVRPCTVKVKGMEVVFLSASDVVPKDYEATPTRPGIASMKDDNAFMERVKATRKANPKALLVLCLHWGVEASFSPTGRQKELAHAFIDAGADLIIGHHPHRMQGVELYKGKPIFYSLGNFQFDCKSPGDETFIAKVTYKGGSPVPVDVAVMPVHIADGGYPSVLKKDEPEYAAIKKKLDGMCRGLGSCVEGEEVKVLPPPPVLAMPDGESDIEGI